MLDCIIVGTGPAGLSAALNLKIHNKDFIWFGSESLSEKVLRAEKIANYPGIPMVSGAELSERFQEHIRAAGLSVTAKTVTNIACAGTYFMALADNEIYQARTLILCTGVMSARTLDNEELFLGRGLSYCASCDGMFYRGKRIAVISNDPRFEHEVEYLAELASGLIFFPSYRNPHVVNEKITVSEELPVAVNGEKKLSSLTLKSGRVLELDGVFCLRNAIAPAQLMPGLALEDGHIAVTRGMETSFPGCFAAGDCTGRPYQYAKAAGEGNVAAHSCLGYLAEHREKESRKA